MNTAANTFNLTLSAHFLGIKDKSFVWSVTLQRSITEWYETRYCMGFGHCRVTTRSNGPHRLRMLPDLARSLQVAFDSDAFVILNPPDLLRVLHSLQLDSQSCASSFDDFCSDLGYENDSRKSLDIYNACIKTRDAMQTLLGTDFAAFENEQYDI